MSDPYLPPEIEQTIFIYALQNDPHHSTNLFLVAKRVYEWLQPIAYKVVVAHYNSSLLDFRSPEYPQIFPSKHGTHIKHLLISFPSQLDEGTSSFPGPDDGYALLDHHLYQCRNVTNLAIWWYEPPLLDIVYLTSLPYLTHLSMDVNRLLELIRGERDIDSSGQTELFNWFEICQAANAKPPLFPNITHLDAMDADWLGSRARDNVECLAHHFPGLTHVAYPHSVWKVANTTVFNVSLEKFERLKVLVWWKRAKDGAELGVDEGTELRVSDERIVVVVTDRERDWEKEARGTGMGIWSLADSVMEKRKGK